MLEALHRATGLPIVADYYTRLFSVQDVAVEEMPLFDVLNRVADAMRMRWAKDGEWLQLRTTSFYDDRLKEVPNRLLERWAASRREHGALTLDDLIEIAGLSDAQLDGRDMAEGARVLFGLEEWDLGRNGMLRRHLRYLAALSPEQRRQAQSVEGLKLTQMSLPQQQGYLSLGLSGAGPDTRLEDLSAATLRVDYRVSGWFQWDEPKRPDAPEWHAARPSPVLERTREAALQAARRLEPAANEAQIVPTKADLTILYIPGTRKIRFIHLVRQGDDAFLRAWQ